MNMNLSHILKDGLIQREEVARTRSKNLRAAPLDSFNDFQTLMNGFVQDNDVPINFAPHGAFWNRLTYEQFINGNVPGVSDPANGQPLKILVLGNSAQSNLIMSLRGTAGTIFDPNTGTIGRMPPSGPFMNDGDIDRIADWIDRRCPNDK